MQNVEVPLTIYGGAEEYVYSSLYASNMAASTAITFIGGDKGMFKLGSGSKLVKTYHPDTDRLSIEVYGDAELNSLSLKVSIASIDSSKFNLPINSNISLSIHSGTTTVNQTVALLPGVEATVDNGATLKIASGKNIYIYDADQWGAYVNSGLKLLPIRYVPDRTYNRTDKDLVDVKIDVNGTIVTDGFAYTTESGADIYSSEGTGKVILNSGAGSETATKQVTQSGSSVTKVDIPITSAKLHNADGSYTETAGAAAGDTFTWSKIQNKWINGEEEEEIPDGWQLIDGNYYYYIDNNPVTGTVRVPYPDASVLPGYGPDAEDAEVNVPGKEGNPDNYDYPDEESALFVFDDNGVFQKELCGLYNDNGVTRWINNGMVVWHAGLVQDGDDYRYFKRSGMVKDIETYVAKTNGLLPAATYTFDTDGKLMQLEGLHNDLNGNLCYYVDYVKSYAGLVNVDGDFYYIASDLKAVKDCTYYVTKTNDLKSAGFYTFDKDGKMIIKNGLIEENGDLYYYVDSQKTAAGLIEVDGNYYYIASDLKAVKDAQHYIFADKANGLVETAGWYWFNADGTMFLEGIREEGGIKYYYKDGVKNYAGLIEIDGAYYYVKSDCSVVCGCDYYVTKNNGLMASATYSFDADGKMILKNGIYREKLGDGQEYLFYYVDNVRQVNTGLVQLDDGKYIYVRSGANLAVGDYYVTKTNGLLPQDTYIFGEDGIMIVNP